MNPFLEELGAGLPAVDQLARIVIRLSAAAALGAVIGYEREQAGKAAGLRTHILVSTGAALFVVTAIESGMGNDAVSRIVQGLATGIGFLGAGSILKHEGPQGIKGLTTAAGIWMTTAVGVAAGLGRWGSAAIGVALTWTTLTLLHRFGPRNDG